MDMMKMLGQLQESQKAVEATKNRLAQETINEKSNDLLLEAVVYKNGLIKDLLIQDELLQDKEQLIDYLTLTLNKALNKAKTEYDQEIEKTAKSGLPKIPGMPF